MRTTSKVDIHQLKHERNKAFRWYFPSSQNALIILCFGKTSSKSFLINFNRSNWSNILSFKQQHDFWTRLVRSVLKGPKMPTPNSLSLPLIWAGRQYAMLAWKGSVILAFSPRSLSLTSNMRKTFLLSVKRILICSQAFSANVLKFWEATLAPFHE